MKTEEIRVMSSEEIHNHINQAREELMNFRFQLASGELTDFSRIRYNRRLIGQMLTVLRERGQVSAEGGKNE